MAYLIQKKADDTYAGQWEIGSEPLRVGRGDGVDVKIDDAKMSRHHFTIETRKNSHFLVDKGSTNGTLVNQQRVSEAQLQPDDRIVAGNTTFIYQSGFGSMIAQISKKPPSYSTVMRSIARGTKPGELT